MKLLWIMTLMCGCAPVRFIEREPVWHEHDDRPIPKPKEQPVMVNWPASRNMIFMPIDRVLSLDYGREAEDVNSLDEVPDSSWYSDPRRNPAAAGGRPLTLGPDKLAWGAASQDDLPVVPLTVVKGKTTGASRGFVVEDSRKVRYLIKLDPPGRPGFASSTEVVVSRLAWAGGWRVPAEVIFDIQPSDLVLSPKAQSKELSGKNKPFLQADLDELICDVPRRPDGAMRVLFSRWIPGTPIGSFTYYGRRKDDPNDRIAHQNRRSLRAFGVFTAWVNDVDALENNELDMYLREPGRGYVLHYQQDVGGAFGVWAFQSAPYWMGHETYFSLSTILGSLLSFGVVTPYWYDDRFRAEYEARARAWPELGGFTADYFEPRHWQPTVSNPAFVRQTERDRYWGAKRLAAFTADEVRAAISAGHYRLEAADRLFLILWRRRERILRDYLRSSSALDYFHFDGERLCFDDVWLTAGLGGTPSYQAREDLKQLAVDAAPDGTGCVRLGPGGGYRVVTLQVTRQGARRADPPVSVHFRDQRILGVER